GADGEQVGGALDDDRPRAGMQPPDGGGVEADQYAGLVVERGLRRVEVFRVVRVGVTTRLASDERDRAVQIVDDRDDEPVAEAVDELASLGAGGEPGGLDGGVVVAEAAQVVDQ